ncbi:hypothetical protein AO501_25165 [Mycobacterium gordonae]|uniref:Uncharacterized protein n=1 Tax=Mycobacterium gordonae TaxID=1778 RepID=A0A0Q2LIF3_MYCGO|nr:MULTISPECIES: hypothetical protein [Mycobacterium]KQH75570.1 hypothetical protein AO501_25165 [Mycobacterium gordonae]MDP7732117.1 hypothetical protein [Mycobacterium sp. TY813]
MSDDIIARAEAALEGISPGPWKIRFNGHWAHVVMTPNGCVWNPDTGKVNDRRNGEFIAAARQLVPELVAELKTTREFRYKVADAVGFVECVESVGNAILADDNTILDYVRAHAETARKHETECPVWCEAHEHFEHVDSCKECGGSGCGPGTATGAHEGCDECGGDGRDHAFAYVHAPDVEAELKTTRAQLRQVGRQLGLFLEDGERNRVIVALAITDGTAEENDA